ncbi:hypothetical protein JMJ77_0013064, partial [Colletotrichum scovillei]
MHAALPSDMALRRVAPSAHPPPPLSTVVLRLSYSAILGSPSP